MSRNSDKRIQKLFSTESTIVAKALESKKANSDECLKERLPIISCECGAEILVVPDLQAMNRAFKTYVAEHGKNKRNIKNNKIASGKISQL